MNLLFSKKLLTLVFALLSWVVFAWEADMGTAELLPHKDCFSVREKATGRALIHIGASVVADLHLLKVEMVNGELVIDSTRFFEKNNKGHVLLFWLGLKKKDFSFCAPGKAFSEKKNVARLIATENCGLQFYGKRSQGGFYSNTQTTERKPLKDGFFEIVSTEIRLPSDMLWASLRQVISRGGVYRIKSAHFKAEVPERENAVNRNWIYNGGAEQNLMYNPAVRFEYMTLAHTGEYRDYQGKKFVGEGKKISVTDAEKHTGKFAFQIDWDGRHDAYAPGISFAPVPVKPGSPVAFSAWLKAARPVDAIFSLGLNGGTGVSKRVRVGTEWKRYEMFVPSWGEKAPGLSVHPGIITAQGAEYNKISPSIRLSGKGSLYVDDAAYYFGGHTKDSAPDVMNLSGTMDRQSSYYFAGDPIRIALQYNHLGTTKMEGELVYEILNFEGRKIAEKSFGKRSFDPNELRNENIVIVPPAGLRGAFNAVVSLRTPEKAYSAVFYAGILNKGGKPTPRVGIELGAMQNTNLIMPYYTDFRIGAVRIGWNPLTPYAWGNDVTTFDAAEAFHRAGVRVMIACYGVDILTKKDDYKKRLAEAVKKLKGKIEYYESINEANLIPSLDPKSNVEAIRILSETVRKIDPEAKIAGPASCGTDLAWTESVLALGGAKYLDAVTEHPYRRSPETPDYALECQTWRKVIDRYKKGLPHYASEAGRCNEAVLPENRIDDFSRQQCALDVRNILQSFAGGTERYMQFVFSAWHPGTVYNVMFRGNGANNGTPVPTPTMYAMRALIDRLEEAKIVRRVRFGSDYRCYIFDHGEKRTAVIWKWIGKPVKIRFSQADASSMTGYDFMGSSMKTDSFFLNAYPRYLDSALSAAEFEKLLVRGIRNESNSKSFDVSFAVTGEKEFAVIVRNPNGAPASCTLSIETPDIVSGDSVRKFDRIASEESVRAVFSLKKGSIGISDRKIKIALNSPGMKTTVLEESLRAILVPEAERPVKIDGDLSDWPANARKIRLDRKNARWKSPSWGAKEDSVKADIRFAWNCNYLYFAAEVFKPEIFSANIPSKLFTADGFQFGFDTMKNALPGAMKLADDDFEYDFGLCDGKATVYRRKSSASSYDSLTKPVGVVKDIVCTIRKYPDRVVYEAAFPRLAVSPFKLQAGSSMRTGVLLNLSNGRERVGFLELTDGIGNVKMPFLWMDFILMKR